MKTRIKRGIIDMKRFSTLMLVFAFGWCASGYYHYATLFKVNPISIEELQ